MDEKSMDRGEVGMAAFVERAAFVADAARDKAPQAIGELDVGVVEKPPQRLVRSDLPAGESDHPVAIPSDDSHLPMVEARNGNAGCRADGGARMRIGTVAQRQKEKR